MLPEKIGLLYVNGYDQPYSSMKGKGMSAYDNKIIECRWHENKWDFMRERVDKSYPNHYTTAIGKSHSSVDFKNIYGMKLAFNKMDYFENKSRL